MEDAASAEKLGELDPEAAGATVDTAAVVAKLDDAQAPTNEPKSLADGSKQKFEECPTQIVLNPVPVWSSAERDNCGLEGAGGSVLDSNVAQINPDRLPALPTPRPRNEAWVRILVCLLVADFFCPERLISQFLISSHLVHVTKLLALLALRHSFCLLRHLNQSSRGTFRVTTAFFYPVQLITHFLSISRPSCSAFSVPSTLAPLDFIDAFPDYPSQLVFHFILFTRRLLEKNAAQEATSAAATEARRRGL